MKKQLSKKIKALRAIMNLTQEELAKIVGVARNRIWSWETGKGAPSSSKMELLIRIGKKHNIDFTIKDILGIGRNYQDGGKQHE